ncbi:hypothetical protein B9Z55_006909 [Caenorhabditis nigoni]|nr:hypothetical protein B9Z55_006909 [Caenorhabditis nigoni]
MKLVVGSISSMEDDKEYSVTEEHFGVPWKLEVKVSNGSLSFHLSCLMSKNLTWSIETDLAFKVSTGSDSLSSRHERRFHNSDGNSQFECGWNDLMSTELLMSHLRDDTIEGILNLADMFDAPTAIRRCEEYLLKNSQKKMSQKLQISLEYNLENLKTKCLSEITTISDIQSIVSLNFKEMDLSTSQALLQKSLEFSNK